MSSRILLLRKLLRRPIRARFMGDSIVWLGLSLSVVWLGGRGLADELRDPTAIMIQVFRNSTEGRRSSRLEMAVSDAAGRERVRTVAVRSLRAGGERKSLVLVEAPADARGTGFITIGPDRGIQSSERWMYLPSLKRVTRIASSEMSGSFMGSDFSYADLSQPSPDVFNYTMKSPEAQVDGESCWLIGAQPKDAEARKTLGYEALELWISKRTFVAIRVKASLVEGNKVKYIKASDLRQVGKYWQAFRMEARTVAHDELLSRTVLTTKMTTTDDPSVTEADFTKARLEQGL